MPGGSGTGTPASAPAGSVTTTADLIRRVRQMVGEPVADLYDDALEIVPGLNDGLNIMFETLPAIMRDLTLGTTAGQSFVDTSARVRKWLSVKHLNLELQPVAIYDLTQLRLSPSTGTPRYYCAEYLSATGGARLELYPTPVSTDADAITATVECLPDALSTGVGGVNPTWHQQHHYLPCYYAASILLPKDNRQTQADSMRGQFEMGIARYDRWLKEHLPDIPIVMQSNSSFTDGWPTAPTLREPVVP